MNKTMSYRSWQEYISTQRGRYRRASREKKGQILNEGCALFDVNRKSLIRAFNQKKPRGDPEKRGRKTIYGAEVLAPLKAIWLAADLPCSKRLRAMLPCWLNHYERHYEPLSTQTRELLLAVSPPTIDRLLAPLRAKRRKAKRGPGGAGSLQGQIPIRTHFQEVDGPGSFEVDTVAHCGASLVGGFVWTLTLTDIWSGWTENAAVWNKKSKEIVKRIKRIEKTLSFEIEEFDSDNGTEFINHRLLKFLRDRPAPILFTRSRPYRKNDNAHVEQKQWTHVRQLLGYDRFENRRLVEMIDDLYRNECRAMRNFFQPNMRLVSKHRQGGRVKRFHSAPRTPYARLMESPKVSQASKTRLRLEFETLDPFALREAIERKLRRIFRIVRAGSQGVKREAKAAKRARKASAA
jgi:hypothetical protein